MIWMSIGLPSFIMTVGVFDDLRTRKISNRHVLALLFITLLSQTLCFGWLGLQHGLWGMLAAGAITLPLVLGRVIGGGDMKLMMVFGMATGWTSAISVLLWSLFWGAGLGVLQALVSKNFFHLLFSTFNVVKGGFTKNHQWIESSPHKVPYSVALAFGWITVLALHRIPGGHLW